MLYTEFEVGDKALKLRITTRACVELEKKMGRNRSALIRMFLVLRMAPGCYGILGPLCHAWPMKLK